MYACANVWAYIRLFKVRLLKSLSFAPLLLQDFNTLKSLKSLKEPYTCALIYECIRLFKAFGSLRC